MRFLKILITTLFVLSVAVTVYIKLSDDSDYSAPVIVCEDDVVKASVKDDNTKLLSYVTASDIQDGDISDQIIIEGISPFINENTAKITYAVCDSDHNVSKLQKEIVFTDYKSPVFSISEQQVYYVGTTRVDLLSGVKAQDSLEGDVSSRVVVLDSQVDVSQPGVYPVTYKVTTEKGVTSEITVNAYVYSARLKDVIELKQYLVYTDSDKKIVPEDYIKAYSEEYINDYNPYYEYKFDIIDNVDYSVPGVQYITYRMTRREKNDSAAESEIIAESYLAVAVRGEN